MPERSLEEGPARSDGRSTTRGTELSESDGTSAGLSRADRHDRLRDREAKFSAAFDEVFRSEGIQVIRTPVRAPKANPQAERCVRTLREECRDWRLILGRRQLERVLREYVEHYNHGRPHRALGLRAPDPSPQVIPLHPRPQTAVGRRDRLGGLIHEYSRAA